MNKNFKIVLIAVIINLVLPKIVRPFASEDEIKPPTSNAKDLPFKSQLVHMMVHHNQVPFSSSIIIALIVYSSLIIAKKV